MFQIFSYTCALTIDEEVFIQQKIQRKKEIQLLILQLTDMHENNFKTK